MAYTYLQAQPLPLLEAEKTLKEIFLRSAGGHPYDPCHTSVREQAALRGSMFVPMCRALEPMGEAIHRIPAYLSERMFEPKAGNTYLNRQPRFLPTPLHEHEYFELICLRQGGCQHFIDTHTITMRPGDIIIIPPGTRHTVAALDENGILLAIGLRASQAHNVLAHIWAADHPIPAFFRRARHLPHHESYLLIRSGALFDPSPFWAQMAEEGPAARSGAGYRHERRDLLLELFLLDVMRSPSEVRVCWDQTICTDTGEQMLRYIRSRFDRVKRDELAAQFNYSERQVARILRAHTGKSFSQLVEDARLDYVANMLAETLFPIGGILAAAGYSSSDFFYRRFRARYHMSPSAYRQTFLPAHDQPER